jgi:hypothetical protein
LQTRAADFFLINFIIFKDNLEGVSRERSLIFRNSKPEDCMRSKLVVPAFAWRQEEINKETSVQTAGSRTFKIHADFYTAVQ